MSQPFNPFSATSTPPNGAPEPGSRGVRAVDGLSQTFDLHALIATFRRRLKLFLSIGLLVFITVLIVTLQATPRYTASAALMIDNRKEQVVESQAVLSGLPADTATVDTEVEILKSRQLAEQVVRTLNLESDAEFNARLGKPGFVGKLINGLKGLFTASAPDDVKRQITEASRLKTHEAVVDRVRQGLTIQRVGLTYVMNVRYTSVSPAKAARIANAFADTYLLQQLEAKFDATRQANTWLNARLAEMRGEVQQSEVAVERYRAANNLLSTSGATLTEQEISTYNQQLASVRAQQAEDEARLRTARAQLAAGSNGEDVGEALGSQVVQQLRGQRAEISGRVADLSSRYGPRHPDMVRAQRQLADIDTQIEAEILRIISNLEARVQVSRERTGSMVGSLASARGALASNNNASIRLKELERNAESARTLYQNLLDRFKQTTSQEGLEQSDARVVSRAPIPNAPSSPNVPMNLFLGFLLAFGAGVGAMILAEMLDSGLSTAADVERKVGLPQIGSIPLVSSVAEGEDRNLSPTDYLMNRPLSAFAEGVRALRTAVQFSRVGEAVKVVAITSSVPGEGKTTTSVCLARSAAQAGQRVVIVDCDLRRRAINRMLGIKPTVGLLEVLNASADLQSALYLDEVSGAQVLPLAKGDFTPKDVFGSIAMDRLLAEMRDRFDLIILDTAPALAVSDTRVVAAKSDIVIFLSRWRTTPDKAVTQSIRLLEQSGAHIAGVALVQVDMRQQARYGYGDAGYYYRAYQQYYAS